MSEAMAVEIGTRAIEVTLTIAMPLLIVSLVTGLLVSLFQVATSLQDVTLTFVPKILAVAVTLIVAAHWILRNLMSFTLGLLSDFSSVVG